MAPPDLYPSEVVAYKCLAIDRGSPPYLKSFAHDLPWWPNQWTYAECKKGRDGIPHEDGCGIYAVESLDELADLHYNSAGVAVVELGLAGEIVVGTTGYRAARARVRHIWVGFLDWRHGQWLAKTYNVPVDLMNVEQMRKVT